MRKKILSLALALAMCLGLSAPALASEPITYEDDCASVTNVLDHATSVEGVYQQEFTCIAPVYFKAGSDLYIYPVAGKGVVKLAADADVTVENVHGYFHEHFLEEPVDEEYMIELIPREGDSVTLTEPGRYLIYLGEEFGVGIAYIINVQAGSETAPDVPVTDPGSSNPADTIPASGTAVASTQTVTVDGKKVEFQMYALLDANGNGTNYIKLRDMAYVLNGTKAQFSVGYDNAAKSISLTTGQAYAAAGGEMTTPFSGDRAYTGGTQSLKIDGKTVDLAAITLLDDNGGGYNYFKLRDLGKALGFNVGWSKDTGVFIESDKPYAG